MAVAADVRSTRSAKCVPCPLRRRASSPTSHAAAPVSDKAKARAATFLILVGLGAFWISLLVWISKA